MRIGIDIRNIGKQRTGDEVVFFNLVKNLAKIDVENEYKLLTDINDAAIISKIKKDLGIENKPNFKVISLTAVSLLRNKFGWNIWTLPRYLRKNPVDVYHTQYITPFFVPKKTKIITTIHDISFNFFPQFIKWTDLFFLKTLIPLSLKRADKIIGVSKFTRDEITKYYKIDQKKVDWVYNSVADNFFEEPASSEKVEEIRKKYQLPEKFILYIGTMQPRKNLPALIEAYAEIKNKIQGIKLVLAGSRNAHNFDRGIGKAIKEHSLEHEVIFPGFIAEEDKAVVFKLALVFCFPSLYEGFGVPVLEAMEAGIPALVSEILPHREIAKDGVLFFNPDDSADFAYKLHWLLSDAILRSGIIQKGKSQAKNFSWKTAAEKTLAIYKSMLETGG